MSSIGGITVVVPAFQASAWIAATIASIRAQTHAADAIIVVDNGSTDDTAALAAAAGATVLHSSGDGPSPARNVGIEAATTRWIAFCDADDLWEPAKLERHALAVERCPESVASISDWTSFDTGGALRDTTLCNDPAYRAVEKSYLAPNIARLEPRSLHRAFYRSMFVLTSAALVRRDVLVGAGLFDDRLRIAEDYDLFLRVFALGDVVAIEEPLVRYRRHPMGISRDGVVNANAHAELWRIIEASPDRYPQGAREFVGRERYLRPLAAGEFAARTGRFREARALLASSLRVRPTFRAALWYALSRAGSILNAEATLAAARQIWQRRRRGSGPKRTKGLLATDPSLVPADRSMAYDDGSPRKEDVRARA